MGKQKVLVPVSKTALKKEVGKKRARQEGWKQIKNNPEYHPAIYHEMTASELRRQQSHVPMNLVHYGGLDMEKKFYDTGLSASNLTASYALYNPSATSMISTPAIGDGSSNRDGKEIHVSQFLIKGTVLFPHYEGTANLALGESAMVALVLDSQANGVVPTVSEIFVNPSGGARTTTCPLKNLLSGSRFKILREFRLDLPAPTIAWNTTGAYFEYPGITVPFEFYSPMDLKIRFNAGTAADIASVVDYCIHVVAVAADVSTRTPNISYNARIRFTA